jgi:hypothetical protein
MTNYGATKTVIAVPTTGKLNGTGTGAGTLIPTAIVREWATGRPIANTVTEQGIIKTPVAIGAPATASPKQAIGRPIANTVGAPGPTIGLPPATSPSTATGNISPIFRYFFAKTR